MRKIQAPNQEAAVFEVSGAKYDVTMLVASVIPAIPLPCA